ncbi:MAG: sulfite dehydrogenase [Maricaulaceae bacterium]|jgi:sulfane dehydrogenase subunit SoxC
MGSKEKTAADAERVAGGGLLHRRALLTQSFRLAGAASAAVAFSGASRAQDDLLPDERPPWMTSQGGRVSGYGAPSPHEGGVQRAHGQGNPLWPGVGASRTPLELLQGIVTPNGLHFERHHSSVPEIDPAQHRLILHGLVRQPLVYDLDALARYPMISRFHFVECGGNSASNTRDAAPQSTCGGIHGLVSCAEWTGVPLSTLLDEAGLAENAAWVIAEGADAGNMVRSIPLEKALDDVIIALYQNGERVRPENGYPMRLLAPGWEGNLNVKWLHRIKVTSGPAHSRAETGQYTDLLPDGRARQFSLPMGVKSVITHPSGQMSIDGQGYYEISGLAWSGHGRIARVDVSADGGMSWAEAMLEGTPMPMCLTRFRAPWAWDGGPALLASRAVDEAGNIQPTHAQAVAPYSSGNFYHYNGIQAWAVSEAGEVSNAFI